MKKYANIIIEITATCLDRPFTYLIPEHLWGLVEIGSIVTIPFGRSNREINGYVVQLLDKINFEESKLKSIISVNQSISIETDLIKLGYWIQKRYNSSMQAALKSMIPSSKNLNKKIKNNITRNVSIEDLKKLIDSYSNNKIHDSKKKALKILQKQESILESKLIKETGITKAKLKGLEKKHIISISNLEEYRNPYNIDEIKETEKIIPNEKQMIAINKIKASIVNGRKDIFLLHGVTGSGKTEVYMQVIDKVIKDGKQAIVLIPEIALTPQTVNRFIGRFGDIVGVSHSKLSQGEKYDQWRKAKEGKISIMIGPRSAIFAPFEKLGIIIIDEEHEMTYKSDVLPKYHAREVAIKRGSMLNCPVVLGSATPLIESYYKAEQKKYILLELDEKAAKNANLIVDVVDMREEIMQGNKTMLSNILRQYIEEALMNKEQIILFLNRRGHSNFVSCRKCGYVVKCPSCDISYTYHSSKEKLICHYCGHTINKLTICPKCQSKYIKEFGIGTQKVENYIKSIFKEARVLRMDFDTTSRKNDYKKIINKFKKQEADILIGTQMVAKGHHFENVTVVGVLAADLSLYLNDFRACERTFQLVTQVTGRTGRGSKTGRAIIQTYSPNHYSIVCSKEQNYKKFYDNEIIFRKIMGYPPFSNIATILMSSTDEKELILAAYKFKEIINNLIKHNNMTVLGPSPANISKIKNNYRWRIIIKAEEYNILNNFIHELSIISYEDNEFQNINIQYDINSMMSY